MALNNRSENHSQDGAATVDESVLSGEVCVKCGFRCIEGCV